MSTTITRRAALTGTVAGAAALAIGAASASAEDAELLSLWAQYLDRCEAYRLTRAASVERRVAFDAVRPECPAGMLPGHHWKALRPLRRKYGVDVAYDTWENAGSLLRDTVEAIRQTPAEGLVGITVKLSAQVGGWQGEDLEEAVENVLSDLSRLTGIEMSPVWAVHIRALHINSLLSDYTGEEGRS